MCQKHFSVRWGYGVQLFMSGIVRMPCALVRVRDHDGARGHVPRLPVDLHEAPVGQVQLDLRAHDEVRFLKF